MKKPQTAKVRVIAFKPPGPKWHPVGEPTDRATAVPIIAKEWGSGHLARIVANANAKAAAKAS